MKTIYKNNLVPMKALAFGLLLSFSLLATPLQGAPEPALPYSYDVIIEEVILLENWMKEPWF